MLFREEYLEKVIRPKIMDAKAHKPKSVYDLCALFGLPPNSMHTVAAWLRELEIPIGDICELSLRARKMMESRGFASPSTSIVTIATPDTTKTTEVSSISPKKKGKLKSKVKKVKKYSGKPGTKSTKMPTKVSKARRHI